MDYEKIEKSAKQKRLVRNIIIYTFLVIWAISVLFPFYWMMLTSVKGYTAYSAESEGMPQLFTTSPTVENYVKAYSQLPLMRYFANTIIFTVVTTALMLVVTVLAAFAFSRMTFKGKNLAFTLFLALMMIPSELVIITNYATVTAWDMRDTFLGLILPSVTSVFYIYLLKENFSQIPDELYYAAKVDGTTDMRYLLKVMVPICRPTIVTVTILKVIECWNSFVWPNLITTDSNYYLVSNGVQQLRESGFGREDIPTMMAAVVLVSIPLIALFLIFRNKIMEGVSRGGVKK